MVNLSKPVIATTHSDCMTSNPRLKRKRERGRERRETEIVINHEKQTFPGMEFYSNIVYSVKTVADFQ